MEKLQKAISAVESSRSNVVNEADNAFRRAMKVWIGSEKTPVQVTFPNYNITRLPKPALVYDVANNAAWLKFPKGVSGEDFIHPKDRNGKSETAFYSTKELEIAQDDYRRACAEARDAVRAELRKLAEHLEPRMSQLVAATTMAIIASALDAHTREAFRRGWALPLLAYGPDGSPKEVPQTTMGTSSSTMITDSTILSSSTISTPSTINTASTTPSDESVYSGLSLDSNNSDISGTREDRFIVQGMWPYWLGGPGGIDPGAIKNSFFMDGMFLLTGPNMAGKSTLLRSTCAVALLGVCGLAVPAGAETVIPYFDAFMLRNFSADSPLEGRSSFAVEMTEMRYVLADATSQSLVLVDELGKGTEARAGAALAGAMLETLAKEGCRGVFATHLHSLLEIELDLPGTRRMMMEIEAVESEKSLGQRARRKPTWRMVEGESVESLALEVAANCRLPEEVVERAASLYEEIMKEKENEGARGSRNSTFATRAEEALESSPLGALGQSQSLENTPRESQAAKLGLPEPSEDLKAASNLLVTTARDVLSGLASSSSSETPSRQVENITAHFVPAKQVPPARIVGASCVYIARRPDGWFYVGSTDSLQDRIKAHRQRGGNSLVAAPGAEFAYIVVSEAGGQSSIGAGSSAAKLVEAGVIKAMQTANYNLLSVTDARKRNAPIDQYLRRDRNARYTS